MWLIEIIRCAKIHGGSVSFEGKRFSARSCAVSSPDREVDVAANKRSAAIAFGDLDASRVKTSSSEHSVATSVHVEDGRIGTMVVVVGRIVFAAVDPTSSSLSVVSTTDCDDCSLELIRIRRGHETIG